MRINRLVFALEWVTISHLFKCDTGEVIVDSSVDGEPFHNHTIGGGVGA